MVVVAVVEGNWARSGRLQEEVMGATAVEANWAHSGRSGGLQQAVMAATAAVGTGDTEDTEDMAHTAKNRRRVGWEPLVVQLLAWVLVCWVVPLLPMPSTIRLMMIMEVVVCPFPLESAQHRSIVDQAWEEVGLLPMMNGTTAKDANGVLDSVTIADCGGDIVTALLLSKHYHRRGCHLSVEDIVKHPTRAWQTHMLAVRGGNAAEMR